MMNILIFKHISDEPPGHAEQWAAERGFTVKYHYWDNDHVLDQIPAADLLIIMGGMMGAYDEDQYPWLKTEKRLIREAVETGRKIVGICLGAQLIASAMGALVYRNQHPEIGFHRVIPAGQPSILPFNQAEGMNVFQWHGDTFDLPEGACLLATSDNVRNQAFSIGKRVVALQFHPEMNAQIISGLLEKSWNNEPDSPWKQDTGSIRERLDCTLYARKFLFDLLDTVLQS